MIIAAPLTAGMSATKGVNPPGRRKEDDVNLVCATLNSGGNSGGFRTEPGEHLVASPITAAYAKSASDDNDGLNGHLVTHALRSEGADASEDGTGRGTPLVAFNIIGSGQEGKNHAYETSVTGAIQHKGNSASGNEAGTVIAFDHCLQGSERTFIHRANEKAQLQAGRPDAVAGGFGVRRLTPTECERLMGLPDGWTAFGDDGKEISDSARYRMLGNSIVVNVSEWIAQRIALQLQ